jgi:hypothetical protein
LNAKDALLAFAIVFTLIAGCLSVVNVASQAIERSAHCTYYANVGAYHGIVVEPQGDPIDNPGGPTME